MTEPKFPRNSELVGEKGQIGQPLVRFMDQVKIRAFQALRGFPYLTAGATVSPDDDYLVMYDASEGAVIKVKVSDVAGVRQAPTQTVLTTASSSYTPPAGCLYVKFRIQAPGSHGNSGNTAAAPVVLRGGSCGTYAEVTVDAADISSGVTVSVGAADSGNPTSIGSPVSVSCPSSSDGATTPGAATGTVDFQIQGKMGHTIGAVVNNGAQASGRDSPLGNGSSNKSEAATGFGSGGASGSNSSSVGERNPSNGTDGVIIADEYY